MKSGTLTCKSWPRSITATSRQFSGRRTSRRVADFRTASAPADVEGSVRSRAPRAKGPIPSQPGATPQEFNHAGKGLKARPILARDCNHDRQGEQDWLTPNTVHFTAVRPRPHVSYWSYWSHESHAAKSIELTPDPQTSPAPNPFTPGSTHPRRQTRFAAGIPAGFRRGATPWSAGEPMRNTVGPQ
jgi:hypothetical protein